MKDILQGGNGMLKENIDINNLDIPRGFILFISGVPGVGKTTISYKLLKQFNEFRIIEETDILRDALRGYNEYLVNQYGSPLKSMIEETEIFAHTKLLTLNEAKQQCIIMKKPIENIVLRQQRKGISSIINGVHIIPEVLKDLASDPNIVFVNLYVNNLDALCKRLKNRDPNSYMLQHVPFIFQTNEDLYNSTQKLALVKNTSFFNLDITSLDINTSLSKIIEYVHLKLQNE